MQIRRDRGIIYAGAPWEQAVVMAQVPRYGIFFPLASDASHTHETLSERLTPSERNAAGTAAKHVSSAKSCHGPLGRVSVHLTREWRASSSRFLLRRGVAVSCEMRIYTRTHACVISSRRRRLIETEKQDNAIPAASLPELPQDVRDYAVDIFASSVRVSGKLTWRYERKYCV